MPLYLSSKSGKTAEFESNIDTQTGVDLAQQEARSKGWIPAVEVVSPKSGKSMIAPQDKLKEFESKGWVIREVADAQASKGPGAGSDLKAAAMGAAQGVSFGFGDEIAGAGSAIKQAVKKGTLADVGKDYKTARDQVRDFEEATRAESPKSFLAGEIAGSLAMPAASVRGATTGAKALSAAKSGAATGAISGLGSSRADLTQGELGQAAAETAIGGTVGAGMGAASQTVTPFRKWLADKFGSKASNEAERSLRLSKAELERLPQAQRSEMSETVKNYLGPSGVFDEAKFLRDKGQAAKAVGASKKGIERVVGDQVIDTQPVVDSLIAKAEAARQSGAEEGLANAYERYAKILSERAEGGDTVEGAFDRIKKFQEQAYKNKALVQSDAIDKQVMMDVRRQLKDNVLTQVSEKMPEGKAAVDQLKVADKAYKKLADLEKKTPLIKKQEELEGGLSRITGGVVLGGLGGLAGGGVGGDVGSTASGTALGLLGHLAMKRKNPLAAYYFNKAQKVMSSKAAEKFGGKLESAARKGIIPLVQELNRINDKELEE